MGFGPILKEVKFRALINGHALFGYLLSILFLFPVMGPEMEDLTRLLAYEIFLQTLGRFPTFVFLCYNKCFFVFSLFLLVPHFFQASAISGAVDWLFFCCLIQVLRFSLFSHLAIRSRLSKMGIEDVRLSVHRIVELSLEISHRFLKKHTYVSGVLFFFFVLYMFLPSIISFLLYIFPFFFCTAVLLKIFWTSERYDVQDRTQERDSKSFDKDVCVDRNERTQTSRRRNYMGTNEGWDSQAGWEEKDMVSWTSPGGISVQNVSSMEETRKEIYSSANTSVAESMMPVQEKDRPLMKPEPSLSDLLKFEGSHSQTHKSRGDYESVSESSEEVGEEEEETHNDGDKAVEWTEDDQKNLMDLGLSEIERNKRLESLIAKRRGRKLFHAQVEEDLVNTDGIPSCPIAKVSVTKHSPFDVPNSFEEMEGFPVPGSAPSVLLPMRNPFDLPYDPSEEKPNLMTDSFHREFTAGNQKELSYCRHESFCFGPSFPLESKPILQEAKSNPFSGTEKWAYECFGNSRFRRPFESGREMTNTLVKEELQGNDREFHLRDCDTNSSLSSENLEENFNGDRAGTLQNLVSTMNNAAHQSVTWSTQSSRTIKEPVFGFCPSASNGNKIDDCFSVALKAACHTPTYSIASDMQVEVSEISSPPITFDGTNSATDGESLTYDGDIEKEMSLGGEETWESDIYRGIENEMDITEVREANEGIVVNNVDIWLSDKRSKDPTPQCNPFDAIPDSTDRPEKSSFMSNDIINHKTEENEIGVDSENNSVSKELNGLQDYESSEKSLERDKILNLIKEKEKSNTSDGSAELRKRGEDEESTLESEDSELPQIFGEPIISGEQLMLDVEEVALESSSSSTPKSILQDQIPVHPISSPAFIVTEMEYRRQSSSSDREAAPCPPMENHLVVGSAAQPTYANDSKTLQDETHSSENSQEELSVDSSHSSEGEKTIGDVDTNGDGEKTTSKSMKELECESETLMGYEADLDPTTPTVRRKTGLPLSSTSGEVKFLQEELIPGIVTSAEEAESQDLEVDHSGTNGDEATISRSLKPKEEESELIATPTVAENNSESKAELMVESEKHERH